MRSIPPSAGSDPSFLLKALGEAAGELARGFAGIRERDLLVPAGWPDDGWCLLAVPYHLVEVERGVQEQIATIVSTRGGEPPIRHVDFDDIPFREDYGEAEVEDLLDELHFLRRRTTYLLWELGDRDWQRAGEHPYRGRVTVVEIARETYQHDLEHLWQVRRMMDALAGARR